MDGQGAGLAEALAALRALERLLFRVDVAVVPQVVLPAEGLVADITGVGTLVRVRPLVDQQVVGVGELPLAVPANVNGLYQGLLGVVSIVNSRAGLLIRSE